MSRSFCWIYDFCHALPVHCVTSHFETANLRSSWLVHEGFIMPDCHWSAEDIIAKINANEKNTAAGMLQSEMNRMSKDDFRRLVKQMYDKTHGDTNDWNNVEFEEKDGEIVFVKIDDTYGNMRDTTLARKGKMTPLMITLALNNDCRLD